MGMGTALTEQGPALANSGEHAPLSALGTVTRPAPVSVGFMAAQEPWDAAAFIQCCHIDATQQRALQLPEWRGSEDDGGASVPLGGAAGDQAELRFGRAPSLSRSLPSLYAGGA